MPSERLEYQLETIDEFFRRLGMSQQGSLILRFLATFARFEYALKRTGYIVPNQNECKPHWTGFASKCDVAFQSVDVEGLPLAKVYLEELPPEILKVVDGIPTWSAGPTPYPRGSLKYHSIMVRRVRNNLFHGEKTSVFIDAAGKSSGARVIKEPSRNEALLSYSLVILEAFLLCDLKVRQKFLDYIPS